MTELHVKGHQVVSRAEWLEDRKRLLSQEKEFTRLGDQLSAERRKLPWVRVEKSYVFDGPDGKETLADLFDQRSQLIVYHFMFGLWWEEGCPSCSMVSDHLDASFVHLLNRDVTLVAISRAPFPEIGAFKKRMGCRDEAELPWPMAWVRHHDRYNVSV